MVIRPFRVDRRYLEQIANLLDPRRDMDEHEVAAEFVEIVLAILDQNIDEGRGGGAAGDARDAFMQLFIQLQEGSHA